ncbi:MAG: hypothetical protein WCL50_17520, partial [Spirochaetota bacterium]
MLKVLVDLRVDEAGLRRRRALPDLRVELVEKPEEAVTRPLPVEVLTDVDALVCSIPPCNLGCMEWLRLV